MKLVNYSLWRLAFLLVLTLSIWTVVFYFFQRHEIESSIDEGLEMASNEFIEAAHQNPELLHNVDQMDLHHFNLSLVEKKTRQRHFDTAIFFITEEEFEPVRMYETCFSDAARQNYRLQIYISTVEEEDFIEFVLRGLAIICITILLIIFFFSKIINRVWRPFYRLLDQLRNFKLNQSQKIEVPKTKIKEFEELNQAALQLLQKNIEAYEEQKCLIENISHEQQTPLAIGIGKLELLLEDEALNEGQAQKIDSVLHVLERIKRINHSVLLISKIKNKQFPEEENLCLNTIVKETLEVYEDLSIHKSITVAMRENGNANVKMNRDLAFLMISNLVKNAIAHNIHNGNIAIEIYDHSLEIKNTGTQEPLSEIIFRRYQSAQNAHSTGLGLSIVKSITNFYNFKIDYSFQNQWHAFKLSF